MIDEIKANPVYQQILNDSIGGTFFDVKNRDKYDAGEILAMWEATPPSERDAANGIVKGVFNFLNEV
jgi:hypothetical protein